MQELQCVLIQMCLSLIPSLSGQLPVNLTFSDYDFFSLQCVEMQAEKQGFIWNVAGRISELCNMNWLSGGKAGAILETCCHNNCEGRYIKTPL